MNNEQAMNNQFNKEELMFKIDALPFGVVRDMIDLIIETNGDLDALINPTVITSLYEQGELINYYNYFVLSEDAMENRVKLVMSLPAIVPELLAQIDVETAQWVERIESSRSAMVEMGYVIVEEDTIVHLPNSTFHKIYKGEQYSALTLFETKEGKFAVLVDDAFNLPFVVSTKVLSFHMYEEQ